MIPTLKAYILGPRIYRIFRWSTSLLRRKVGGDEYTKNLLESVGETVINSVNYACTFSYYCSPVILYYMHQKGLITSPGQPTYIVKFLLTVWMGVICAYVLRGFGRFINPEYRTFLGVLQAAQKNRDNREDIQLYDFEFHAWPRDFHWSESDVKSDVVYEDLRDKTNIYDVLSWPSQMIQYFLMHGLGRPMAYPGSVKLLQLAMGPAILDGRTSLIEKNGLRAKLVSEDGNEIDTMFIDRRGDKNLGVGNTLIITCEGNAAYYEVGCMGTPMKAGYSTLGWNHPGFFGSSGSPNAESEKYAVDVVIRYAVTRLGFPVENIMMFAWSIGGYPASYAAMMYPSMKGLVLDATFDNITELALNRMPGFADGLVRQIVRNYLDLDVARHCINFPGPIRLIRRQRDEIISVEPGVPDTNRGNTLLLSILQHRYPKIFIKESVEFVKKFLGVFDVRGQAEIIRVSNQDASLNEARLALDTDTPTFPLDIGEEWTVDVKKSTALYLSRMHMDHFDATHCMPLPSMYLKLPWQHKIKTLKED